MNGMDDGTGNVGDEASIFGGFPINTAGMKMAADTGRQYAEGLIARMINVRELRRYFAVSTDYVLNKLKLILFPYFYRGSWQRSSIQLGKGRETYPPPRADINAPDLYIPVMGFVTYIIICSIVAGFAGGFKPEMLGIVASKALFLFAIDVVIVRLGYYLLSKVSQSVLDCAALCGYVFVGVALNELAQMIGGKWLLYPCLAFTWAGMSYFLMHTVRVIMLTEPSDPEVSYQASMDNDGNFDSSMREQSTRRYYLLFLALLQLVVMYFLAFTPVMQSNSVPFVQGQPRPDYMNNDRFVSHDPQVPPNPTMP